MKRVDFLLDESVVLQVEQLARERSLSKSGFIRKTLESYLEAVHEVPDSYRQANQEADK